MFLCISINQTTPAETSGDDRQPLDAVWEIAVTVVGTVAAGVIMLLITKRYHDRRHADDTPPPESTSSQASNGLGDVNGFDDNGDGNTNGNSNGNGSSAVSTLADKNSSVA